jgi:hypothetical protein
MDMRQLKPLREEGQASFSMLAGALASLGVSRVLVHLSSHLVRLQLLRLIGARGVKDAFQFTVDDGAR